MISLSRGANTLSETTRYNLHGGKSVFVQTERVSKKAKKQKLPPSKRLSELAKPEAIEKYGAKSVDSQIEDLTLRYQRLLRETCSAPWMDAVWEGEWSCRRTPNGYESMTLSATYAPDAPCYCEDCRGEKRWPNYYIGSRGMSRECEYNHMSKDQLEMLPGSTSSVSLRRLKAARLKGKNVTGGF